jgi:Ca2+-binding RTX toxin-like protein
MGTRTAGAVRARALMASVLTSALLATTWSAAAHTRQRLDTCFGEDPTIEAEADERVDGTDGKDVVLGGYDVWGYGGDDLICDARIAYGGPGDDRIRTLDGGTAKGNGGNDEFISISIATDAEPATLIGGPGHDLFWGGPLREVVRGGGGGDEVRTGGGPDFVDLGSGSDEGYGGPDDDTYLAGSGDDYVDGGPGLDRVNGGPGIDRCRAVESLDSCGRVR